MKQRNAEHGQSCDEVDLSPAAIEQRLDEVGQLYELGLYLAQATPLPDLAVAGDRRVVDE